MKSVRWRLTGAVAVSAMAMTPLIALPAVADDAAASIGDLTVLGTTDVHGNLFNWDYFADSVPAKSADQRGLARVATVVNQVRAAKGAESVLVVDNGDFVQGTPLTYLAAEQPDRWSPRATRWLRLLRQSAMMPRTSATTSLTTA